MKTASFLIAATVGLCLASPARASVMYNYIAKGAPGTSVNLYLQEVSTAGSFTAASDGGLYSGGVALVEQPGGTGVSVAFNGVTNNSGQEPTGFSGDDYNGLVSVGGAWLVDTTNNSAKIGVAPISSSTSGGTTTSLYYLGNVALNINSNPHATFAVESIFDAGVGNASSVSFNSGFDLDVNPSSIPGATGADGHPTYLTFGQGVSTPEPASVALFGIGAFGLLARRRQAQ